MMYENPPEQDDRRSDRSRPAGTDRDTVELRRMMAQEAEHKANNEPIDVPPLTIETGGPDPLPPPGALPDGFPPDEDGTQSERDPEFESVLDSHPDDWWDRLVQADYDEAGRMVAILHAEMRMCMKPGEGYAPAWMFPPDYIPGRTAEPSPTQVHSAPPQAFDSRSALTVESDTTDPTLQGDEPSVEPVSHPDDPEHVPDEAYRRWLVTPPREDWETEAQRSLDAVPPLTIGQKGELRPSEQNADAELDALLRSWSQRETPASDPLPPPPDDEMTDIDYVWGPSYVDEDPSVMPSGFLTPVPDRLDAFEAESADLAAEVGVLAQTGMDTATDNAYPVDPRFDGPGVRALRDLIRDTNDPDARAALDAFVADRADAAGYEPGVAPEQAEMETATPPDRHIPWIVGNDGGTNQRVEDQAVGAEFAAIFRAEDEEQATLRERQNRVEYQFGIWAAPPTAYALRAEKSWVESDGFGKYGLRAVTTSLPLAEVSDRADRNRLEPLAQELNMLVQQGQLSVAMQRAEQMAVANGFLDPHRSDPRLFTEGPTDEFATLREMDIDQARDAFAQFQEGYTAAEGTNPPQLGENVFDAAALDALETELADIEAALAAQDIPEPDAGRAPDAPFTPDLDI
ncbi:MAG: hypothetical protein ACYDBJ_10005 [Aggregatilineales bacterium]